MAQPVRLAFRSLSLDETARFLGVPRSRAREIEALVESGLNGIRDHANRTSSLASSMKRTARKTIKRAGAKKAR